jgi:hypothetical protein
MAANLRAQSRGVPMPMLRALHASRGAVARPARRGRMVTLAFLGVTALGCGGAVESSPPADGGGTTDSTSTDSGNPPDSGQPHGDAGGEADGGPWSVVCPATVPGIGSPCSQDTIVCEYGDAWWNVACDTIAQCSSGQWSATSLGVEPCLGAPGPNPPQCPTNGYIVDKTPCENLGLTCNYLQGVVCQCVSDAPTDSGSIWDCPLDPTCPTTRPRLGASCVGEQTCTYELCAYSEICQGGVWQPQPDNCQ